MRVFVAACVLLLLTLAAGEASGQAGSPEKAASLSGLPVIGSPASGDTVGSMWVNLSGAIPPALIGKCREVQVYVNHASRGKAKLRGVRFTMENVALDCLGPQSQNVLKVVCAGPSLKVESEPVRVSLLPGPLEIEADLTSDAICPGRDGDASGAGGPRSAVTFHFNFSTPADWTLRITGGAGGKLARAAEGKNVSSAQFDWNGADGAGKVVPDGEYIYEVVASSVCGNAGTAHYAGVITVDTSTPGKPRLMGPVNDDIVSPTFNLTWEPAESAWFYEIQLSESPDFEEHELYSTGATQLRFSGRSDGVYNWRVRAVSRAGAPGPYSDVRKFEVRKVMQPAISMLGVTTVADGMVPEKGETMRVTYMANDDIVVTIRIVTPSGKVVRTLLDGVRRGKGPHVEMWDGRDDGNELVTAGSYVASIEAEGTDNVTAFSESRLVTVQY